MWCRGIRGATTVDSNTKEDILNSAKELLQKMIDANGLSPRTWLALYLPQPMTSMQNSRQRQPAS